MQLGASSIEDLTLPGYELLERAGEGGMGEVYRARKLDSGRVVAVKFISRLHEGSPAAAPGFKGEAHVLASLRHANIVALQAWGEVEGRFYIVMDFVEGSTLRSLMQPGRPWPVDRAIPVLDAVARALSYIHEQGLLHLDMKPENVLISREGEVKISDFGLALTHSDAVARSAPKSARGSADYCAPEQQHGLGTSPRSDLFSLATMAYELLTGRLPGRVYVPASRRNKELNPGVDPILRRGLARHHEDRPETVEEFRQALLDGLKR